MDLNEKLAKIEEEQRIELGKVEVTSTVEDEKPKMTQEQARAVLDIAKKPEEFIGVKISQKASDLIEHDKDIQSKFDTVAKSTVHTSLETFENTNKRQSKKNYFELNKKDIMRLGGDSTSTKGQQMTAVVFSRMVWFIIMSTIGGLFIVPTSVILEFFQGLSYRKVEEKIIENEQKLVVSSYKLGKLGVIVGIIFSLAWCGLLIYLFILEPLALLISCITLAIIIGVINIFTFVAEKIKLKTKKEEEIGVEQELL